MSAVGAGPRRWALDTRFVDSSAAERNTFEMVPNILYSQTRGVSTVRGIMDDTAVKSGTATTRIQAKWVIIQYPGCLCRGFGGRALRSLPSAYPGSYSDGLWVAMDARLRLEEFFYLFGTK